LVDDARHYDVLSGPLTLSCPLVIVHGARDDLVPLAVSEEFLWHVRAPEKRFIVVPDGDHRLTSALVEILAVVDRLMTRAISPPPSPAP